MLDDNARERNREVVPVLMLDFDAAVALARASKETQDAAKWVLHACESGLKAGERIDRLAVVEGLMELVASVRQHAKATAR